MDSTINIGIALIILVVLIAIVATVRIGVSKENKESNPTYFQKSGKNLLKITIFYVICGLLGIGFVVAYIIR